MRVRLRALEEIAGKGENSTRDEQIDQLILKIEEANEQVWSGIGGWQKLYDEKLSLVNEVSELRQSLKSQNRGWLFTDEKHINEMITSDDELLQTLEKVSNDVLVSNHQESISSEIASLSAEYVHDQKL